MLDHDNSADPRDATVRLLVLSMLAGAVITVALAIYLAAAVEPFLIAIAAIALIDLGIAWAFASGAIGPRAEMRREAAANPSVASEADPSYNPYARED